MLNRGSILLSLGPDGMWIYGETSLFLQLRISCLRTCTRTDCGTSVRERAEEQGAGCWGPRGGISVKGIEPCLAMARFKALRL